MTDIEHLESRCMFASAGFRDLNFGANGTLSVNVADSTATPNLALQPSGRIILDAGSSLVGIDRNGQIDTSFGIDGYAAIPSAPSDLGQSENFANVPHSLAINRRGAIYVLRGLQKGYSITAFRPNGTLFAGFSDDGQLFTKFRGGGRSNAIAVGKNGKILVAGQRGNSAQTGGSLLMNCFNADGTRNINFGIDGQTRLPFNRPMLDDAALAVQPNGKIVVAATDFFYAANGYSPDDPIDEEEFAVARYNANGSLDKTFAKSGKTQVGYTFDGGFMYSLDILAHGKISLVGAADQVYPSYVQLDSNGRGVGGGSPDTLGLNTSITQADGKVIIYTESPVRWNSNATLDNTFHSSSPNPFAEHPAILLDSQNRIIVAVPLDDGNFAVYRYFGTTHQ